jgi:WG containing repeat
VLPLRNAVVTTTLLLILVTASAAEQNTASRPRQPDVDKNGAIGTPCLFDLDRGEVPNCIHESKAGGFSVSPKYLKALSFDAHGLAAVNSRKLGWTYVNRRGKVVITGVPVMDNGADRFHDGLVRIVRSGKYGFANRRGKVVVAPIYDGAMNFENGRAAVCKGCESKCVDFSCEYHSLTGGEWFQIDAEGTVLTRLHPHN